MTDLRIQYFRTTSSENGYRYKIKNNKNKAKSLENYSIAFQGGMPDDPNIYKNATCNQGSKIPVDGSLYEEDVIDLVSPSNRTITHIGAGGSEEFCLYIKENGEFYNPINLFLQEDGVSNGQKNRVTIPPESK